MAQLVLVYTAVKQWAKTNSASLLCVAGEGLPPHPDTDGLSWDSTWTLGNCVYSGSDTHPTWTSAPGKWHNLSYPGRSNCPYCYEIRVKGTGGKDEGSSRQLYQYPYLEKKSFASGSLFRKCMAILTEQIRVWQSRHAQEKDVDGSTLLDKEPRISLELPQKMIWEASTSQFSKTDRLPTRWPHKATVCLEWLML